jgi:septal ring factor EnvC (AmiA/AmiB activator)
MRRQTDIQQTYVSTMMQRTGDARFTRRQQGEVVRDSSSFTHTRTGFIPPEFHDVTDVAECALDEQLEQLQRRYAAASRAAARARFELELLEKRDDLSANVIEQARKQRAAAETRSQQLLRAIDALEDRLEVRDVGSY